MVAVPLLFGPYGGGALTYIERFADFGANACWFHGFDATAFEACQRGGIAACVEFPTFRADFNAHPELIPIGVDGHPIRYGELVQGICLSQDEYVQQIEQKLIAGMRDFKPTGVWLDYLTGAGWFETPTPDLQLSCFCRACVADFCATTGVDAASPREIVAGYPKEWTRYMCERIAAFGLRYATIIRDAAPGCVVGAYMCPWTPDEFDGALRRIFAQDYALLEPAIDVWTPLIYAKKSGRPPTWGREFLATAPQFAPESRKLQLILDAQDYPASLEATATAERPSWGIQLFGGAEVFADVTQAPIFRAAVERIRGAIAQTV